MRALNKRTWLDIKVTNACNLKCVFCGQVGNRQPVTHLACNVLFQFTRKVLPDLDGVTVYLWGGEPLLHPEIAELIRHMAAKRAFVMLNTNGVYLNTQTIQMLATAGLSAVVVSIDGPASVHDRMRGRVTLYNHIVSVIPLIKKRGMQVYVNCVVVPGVGQAYSKMVRELCSCGVDSVRFSLPLGIWSSELEPQLKHYAQNPNLAGFIRAWTNVVQDISSKALMHTMRELMAAASVCNVECHLPWDQDEDPLRRLECHFEKCGGRETKYCRKLEESINISSNGMIVGCPDIPIHSAGDIYNAKETEIYSRIADIRQRFTVERWPWCKRCCHAK